ncbi:MAG: hypothetical protein BRC33_10735 [Cyanobacteria bacterium SW_9_44_58]|nr:MAG: hypothetical protein BRC33_10735 [Cyanobacteria bacterium SW_9_44_58]
MLLTPKSGLFLLISCVAAIAAVGSVFELSYGDPRYGVFITSIILSASIPLTGATLWVAVKDARANLK